MSEAFAGTGRFTAGALPFAAGFAGRHADIGDALRRAFAPPPGFAPTPPGRPAPEPVVVHDGPRHFRPADRDANPTEGWDPFDAPATPVADPVAAARAEGYAEGLRAALDEAAAERARDMALMDQLARAVAGAAWLDRDNFAQRLRQTVLALVGNLVAESGIDGERLAARVTAATDLLADNAEAAILRLNPADVTLVEGRLPKTVFAIADAAIARGAFSLEAASTIVEDGPARWLEQLAQAIDQVPLPKC
ncbi:FliH/SctL family protein [Sphingomonas sp. Y38-1Y]|uniref:FliH/SctL family protein n=1 Tax=Sphingomonas sp. Y38-1Y TaxID=3078265 RepID=UPI0028E613AD|nr:FliH/SctL family protein [Sphingomonas sp. Y38-1Y]